MKRVISFLLCFTLTLGAFTYRPPQSKAFAITATLIGEVVGTVLLSMGLAWTLDQISENLTGQKFGESVARELQDWLDEEHDCEVIDVFFGGMMPNVSPDPSPSGNVVLTASAAFIAAVSAFGKWLYDKYALSENETAVIYPDNCLSFQYISSSGSFVLDFPSSITVDGSISLNTLLSASYVISVPGTYTVVSTGSYDSLSPRVNSCGFKVGSSYISSLTGETNIAVGKVGEFVFDISDSDINNGVFLEITIKLGSGYSNLPAGTYNLQNNFLIYTGSSAPSLSVSAPNGLNLPDTDALPEGQGYALELPDTSGAPVEDLNDLLDLVIPLALTDPAYVPTLNPTELPEVDPDPTPSDEEVPDPAPEGATIIDYLVDIWRKIKALPETIGNAVKSAFEPDPELVTEITTTFTDKFGWLETIHQLGLDLCGLKPGSEPPVIYIHLEDATGKYNYGGLEKALDMSWYEPYKEDVDNIISGFMWLAFLWLVFKRAADIINGAGMVSDYEFYGTHEIGQPRLEEHKK